jgi:hypothetical protein
MTAHQQLDAVLPLKFNDYKRFSILRASLKKFMKDLRKLFVIVPDKEVESLRSKIKDNHYKIIPETAVVPEFKLFKNYPGWNKQQLIKLAAAEIVETDFYLTLDADIICVRPTSFSDLVKDGRAYCFKHGLERSAEMFKQWYRDAERVLKINHAEYHHDVTPAVLSREGMLRLHKHLARISRNSRTGFNKRDLLRRGVTVLAKFIPKMSFADWRLYLLRSGQWTEYSLYYAFLEAFDLFEKYHFLLDSRISGNSVWEIDQYDSWDPASSFLGERTFYFSVIQSNTGINPDEIWEKVRPYLRQE